MQGVPYFFTHPCQFRSHEEARARITEPRRQPYSADHAETSNVLRSLRSPLHVDGQKARVHGSFINVKGWIPLLTIVTASHCSAVGLRKSLRNSFDVTRVSYIQSRAGFSSSQRLHRTQCGIALAEWDCLSDEYPLSASCMNMHHTVSIWTEHQERIFIIPS